ncbi:phytoene/squalene synthase family protein [Devosia nitrariae]|uniref:Phytoene synthase n=1 Tax=Devosia nitrariae TaxID=2071872 RepID=A0ABQ5WCQ1_9HYPH|nr:phytoene/squalene synthase family protein [Devosia nitrariae]GLQ57607.1 phytoene synthase [Devosia nitrariae]
MARESFAHAENFLRQNDRDRYLSTLVLRAPAREAIIALYAFNADVAMIRERAREPAPGEVRLQWWNDALAGEGHGAVRQNPLADALMETVERYAIPVGTLQRLLGARRFDLYDDPMRDLESFEGYAGETSSTLLQVAAMILNDGRPVETGDAAGHLGVAQAMVGHLRAFGYNAAMGRIFLPWSILAANGVRESEVFSGTVSEGLVEALCQIVDLAGEHLAKAQAAIAELPRPLRAAFAGITVAKAQLQAFSESAAAPFSTPPDLADWRKIWLLTWWTWRNR